MPDDQFADEQRATVRMRADGADDSAAAVGRFQYDARFEFRSQLLQRLQQRGNPEVVQQFGFASVSEVLQIQDLLQVASFRPGYRRHIRIHVRSACTSRAGASNIG